MLILVMLMEYKERGLFFGWPNASSALQLSHAPMYLIRRYHAYAFSWAAVFTFWFHPMENTLGHAMGFGYTYIILLQGENQYTSLLRQATFSGSGYYDGIVSSPHTVHSVQPAYCA